MELLDERKKIILAYVSEYGRISNKEVQELLTVKESRSLKVLKELVKMGILEKVGKFKGSYYVLANQ